MEHQVSIYKHIGPMAHPTSDRQTGPAILCHSPAVTLTSGAAVCYHRSTTVLKTILLMKNDEALSWQR